MTSEYHTVYCHTNKTNGKKYIGITCQKAIHRWGKDGNGYKHQVLFWRAIRKYGWDGFKHEILYKNISKERACDIEKELIEQYQAADPKHGYNVSTGGDTCKGFKHTAEAKRKISEAGKLHPPSKECKEKSIAAVMKKIDKYTGDGVFVCSYNSMTEAAKIISVNSSAVTFCCKGTIKKLGGYVFRYAGEPFDKYDTIDRTNEKQKKQVIQIDMNGTILRDFQSTGEAARTTKLSQGNIASCCRGERRQTGGYLWRYDGIQ